MRAAAGVTQAKMHMDGDDNGVFNPGQSVFIIEDCKDHPSQGITLEAPRDTTAASYPNCLLI